MANLKELLICADKPVQSTSVGCKGFLRKEIAAHFERRDILTCGRVALFILNADGVRSKKHKQASLLKYRAIYRGRGIEELEALAWRLGV